MTKNEEESSVTDVVHHIELEPLTGAPEQAPLLARPTVPFLGSVKVRVTVRVGCVQTSVDELLELKQGAVLALDRLVDQPLDVLVHDHVVARGMLVAVGEYFGVCITEAASTAPTATQP